jgi:hypothetical protein
MTPEVVRVAEKEIFNLVGAWVGAVTTKSGYGARIGCWP